MSRPVRLIGIDRRKTTFHLPERIFYLPDASPTRVEPMFSPLKGDPDLNGEVYTDEIMRKPQ
ncbi:hypothetical protein P8936_01000 [Edaphobacter paludis]|uniref:Transposase n=1 Tax=Edaphobacter paludis TaxID=3035702 RepID=A0AAU7D857_9BACT